MRILHVSLVGVCTILALAGCSAQTQQFTGGDPKLFTQAGAKEGGIIKANGQPGFLVYGP